MSFGDSKKELLNDLRGPLIYEVLQRKMIIDVVIWVGITIGIVGLCIAGSMWITSMHKNFLPETYQSRLTDCADKEKALKWMGFYHGDFGFENGCKNTYFIVTGEKLK